MEKIKKFYLNKKIPICGILSAAIPFIFYILTLERKLVGGDTSWYMIELPQMSLLTKATPKVMIESNFKNQVFEYGKEIIMEYIITNNSNDVLKINSIELDLPKGLKFDGMFDESNIKDGPGIGLGKYMWVSDDYFIPINSKINFTFKITPEELGDFKVNLRLTTGGVFFSAKEMAFKLN